MARISGEKRGSSYDRRARIWRMLAKWGDGQTCKCVHCKVRLDYTTLVVDRVVPGGSYADDNVQPSCWQCNSDRGADTEWRYTG